jgi:hypothetical protein
VALVAAGLVAAGCGSSEDETPGIPQSGERITTTSTSTTTTPTTAADAGAAEESTTTTTAG